MKTCSKCGAEKEELEFYSRTPAKNGLASHCKSCIRVSNSDRYYNDYGATLKREREKRVRNRDKIRETSVAWNFAHQEHVRETSRVRRLKRRNEDPLYKMTESLRSRVNTAIRAAGASKNVRTIELLGCPVVWLEFHLESLFKPGMTWKNYGPLWHVDHVRPCASFNLLDPEQQKICFHWTNLQPLFAKENIAKGDSYDG